MSDDKPCSSDEVSGPAEFLRRCAALLDRRGPGDPEILSLRLFDGSTSVIAFPIRERVYIRLAKGLFLDFEPDMAERLSVMLAQAALEATATQEPTSD